MNRMLTRLLSLLLILCLLPLGALAEDITADESVTLPDPMVNPLGAAPESETEIFPTLPEGTPQGLTVIGDALYALSWSNLYRKVDEGWVAAINGNLTQDDSVFYNPSALAATENTVYMLAMVYMEDTPQIVLLHTSLENGQMKPFEKLYDLDLGDKDYYQFYGMTADEDSVYFLAFCQSANDWGNNTLYRVSLTDGKVTRVTRDYLTYLQPYKDGQLLAHYWNQEKAYQPGGENLMPSIVALDKQTGAMTPLCTLPKRAMFGMTYDSTADMVYIASDSGLYRYDASFSQATLCAYLAPGGGGDAGAAVFNGQYYSTDWRSKNGLQVVSTDPSALPSQVLRIAGYSNDDEEMIRAYTALHPDVAFIRNDEYTYSTETITQQMLSGDNSADIYAVYFGAGNIYSALRDKGYCLDLSGSQALTDTIARMYPNLTKHLWKNEKLCAIPASIGAQTISYFPAALENVGLTEDDLPRNLSELIDFCILWGKEYADEYPEYQLFRDAYNLQGQILDLILKAQIAQCAAEGIPLTFDTPVMKKLLTKLEQAAPMMKEYSLDLESSSGILSYSMDEGPRAIFSPWADLVPSRYGSYPEWDGLPLLLAMDEGMEPAYIADMSGYLVNPNTQNKELAISYLEFVMEHMNQASKIAMMPYENDPMENEWYRPNLESMQKTMADLEKQLTELTDPAEQADLKETIERYQQYLTEQEKDRWAISAEQIAAYREVGPRLFVDSESALTSGGTEVSTLMQRYLDGQINGEKFLKELSRILRMIQLEAQ